MRLDHSLEETERVIASGDTSPWQRLVDRLIEDCHPEQRDFVCDLARRIIALVGRGGGKTTAGRVRLVKRLLTAVNAQCIYIATTRDHAERLMWEPLKRLFHLLGFVPGRDVKYNETKLKITIPRTGSTLILFGADKPKEIEKLRGIPFHEVHIDEAASYGVGIVEDLITKIIGPRLGDYGGCICVYGTPGNRLQGLFYEISRPGSKRSQRFKEREPGFAGWSLHKWTIDSAIEATRKRPIQALLNLKAEHLIEFADQGWSPDHPIRRREYDGEWAADNTTNVFLYRIHDDEGNLLNQWDPPRIGPFQLAELPNEFNEWIQVIILDLGHSDPTAINIFATAVDDPSRTIYHRWGFEATKMYAQTIAHKLIGERLNHGNPDGLIGALGEWPNAMVADSAHQMAEAILAELSNVYGIVIQPATKGYKYKYGAIEVVNGDFFDDRIKILKGSILEKQLIDLQWAINKFEQRVERKDQPNHSTDTLIYGRAALGALMSAGSGGDEIKDLPIEPPMPDEVRDDDDYSHMFRDDYESLLG